MLQILQTGKVLYVLAAVCGLGIISKLVTSSLYKRLIKESGNMVLTKNKNLRSFRQKTENMLMLSHGIRNTNAYIEKQLYGFRFMKLSLDSWDNLSVQSMILCFLLGGIAAFGAYWYRCDSYYIVLYGSMGILTGLFMVLVDNSVNIAVKRQQLMDCLIDYVDNTPHFFRSVDKSANQDSVEMRGKNAAESSKFRLREMGRKTRDGGNARKGLKVVEEAAASNQTGKLNHDSVIQEYRGSGEYRNDAENGDGAGYRGSATYRSEEEYREIAGDRSAAEYGSEQSGRKHGKFSVLSRKKGRKEPALESSSRLRSGRGASSPGDFSDIQKNIALEPEEELRRSIDGLKQSLEQIAASRDQGKRDGKALSGEQQERPGVERAKRELSQEDIKLLGELLQEYLT